MSKILFCDWESDTGDYDSNTLLDITNLNQYDVLFFDPHGFTNNNGFRENRSDLRLAEYKSYSETEFLSYLAKIKKITEQLHEFLDSGGVWVIRSTMPNSSIKIRKKSSAGQSRYTESIISFFFWLEEFLGTYSFQYSLGNAVKFTDPHHPITQTFRDLPMEYVQTQDRISRGTVEILAGTKGPMSLPALSKVSFGHNGGEIYFIPKFLAKDEHVHLAKTFGNIAWEKKFGPYKPAWVRDHEGLLTQVNPYVEELKQLNTQIEELSETRSAVEEERERIQSLIGLLFQTGDNLVAMVKSAMSLIGFSFPNPPVAVLKSGFDFYARDEQARQIIGLALSTTDGPILYEEFERISEKINNCNLMDKPKSLIVANSSHSVPPDERREWFTANVIEEASTIDCCLLPTSELFQIVCYLLSKSDSPQLEFLKRSVQKDILACNGIFEINDTKYPIRVRVVV